MMLTPTRLPILFAVAFIIWHPQGVDSFGHSPRPCSAPPPVADHDAIIVGGSIVGLAAAVSLSAPSSLSSSSSSSPSNDVVIYERARRAYPIGALLSLFPNGLTALRSIDAAAAEEAERASVPLRASEIRSSADGKAIGRAESNDPDDASGGTFLCWHQLQRILASALDRSRADGVRFGTEFVSYAVDDATGLVAVTCRDRNDNDSEFIRTCRALIGADGVQSAVRRRLAAGREAPASTLNSYNRTIFRALVDVDALDDESILPPEGVAVIYKSDVVGQIFKMWTASDDAILAVTATINSDEDDAEVRGWNEEEAKEKMTRAYAEFAPEVRDLIRRLPASSIYANAVCDAECLEDWSDGGPVVVIGDAAHGMTPSLGQGANVGLEDAAEIGHSLRDALADDGDKTRIVEAINNFCSIRRERVHEIHAASRRQALNKNRKDATLGSFRRRDPAFFERLYGWRPTGDRALDR